VTEKDLTNQVSLVTTKPTKVALGSSSRNTSDMSPPVSQNPLHVSDVDEEDESVKQLNECAAIYLSLQALPVPGFSRRASFLFPSIPIFGLSDCGPIIFFQDCLVDSNRNWKACQARKCSNLAVYVYLD
jgi:cytochrome c oxidase assembly factor 4